jgi:uncharacterized iron-regulated membrane protein
MTVRKIFFWLHLTVGTTVGAVVLLMSVTGVLLTYERQMTAWADREFRSTSPSPGAARLPVDVLLTRTRESQRSLPATFTIHADPVAAAEASFSREHVVYIDVYSGAILGEGSRGIRTFFRAVTDWHRWFGAQTEGRPAARAITGACNLVFLFIVLSGTYLWLPRKWSWQSVRAVMLFRGGLTGKARDFNWHNVIGMWSAVPLFLIVLGGVVISYPWATTLLYTVTGNPAPKPPIVPAAGPGARGPVRSSFGDAGFGATARAWALAEQRVAGWRTISLRIPPGGAAPLTFTIDEAHRGRPDKRSLVTVNALTGQVISSESFSEYNTGRRLRMWLRWIHTGEAGGILGQTIAGIASAGAVVLVWTGIALSLRRFRAWRARAKQAKEEPVQV